MTTNQSQAVWELCRQGFPLKADEAAALWEQGKTFEPDLQLRIPRAIERLIALCNWEIREPSCSN